MRDLVRVAAALVFLAVLVVACGPDLAAILDVGAGYGGSGTGLETGADASSSSSNGGASDSDSAGPSSASSGDGPSSDSEPSSGGDDSKAVPVEVEVFVSPSPATAVGEVQVSVWTSRPVASIDLYDGDAPLVLGAAPANPVHVFEVTSDDAPGDGTHTIRAVAHAADGVSGQDVEDLVIDVQPGGTDVWPPYVKAGPINGFTSAALLGNGIGVAGFFETNQALEAVAVRIDGGKGQPEGATVLLGPVAATGGGRGPAIAAAGDDAAFVAWTRPDNGSTRWAVSRVVFGEAKGPTWSGPPKTSAHAIAVAGDVLIVVGAVEAGTAHDLRVWWVSAVSGEVLHEQAFAASPAEDNFNKWDEVARGVAIVASEIVVVGERETKNHDFQDVRRTVILRFSLEGEALGEWTSPGELMDEDAGMAVAPLRGGGFIVTGWGRNLVSAKRLVLTRWFTAAGDAGPVRIEPTTTDAVGFAVGEDREGKIIVVGAVQQPLTEADAWIFAVSGPLGEHTWDVVRNGPGQGPDETAGLAVDAWGYVYAVGSEFDALQPRAFALRLYP